MFRFAAKKLTLNSFRRRWCRHGRTWLKWCENWCNIIKQSQQSVAYVILNTHKSQSASGWVCKIHIWAGTRQNQQSQCAPSEDSDQPGHLPTLIRVFAVRMKKAWVLSYPLSAQRRLRSDWADAQADLSLCWVHSHAVGFVMSWLICTLLLYQLQFLKFLSIEWEKQTNSNTCSMGPVKRICVFEHSVMTNCNCACPAIQRG